VKRNIDREERTQVPASHRVEQQSSMVCKEGIWVHLGKTPNGFDWDKALDAFRDEWIKDFSGY
jgi:hypothetical protein